MQYKLLTLFRQPVNSRKLKLLCNDRGTHYENLNFHAELRWLSCGKVLVAVCRLRIELQFLCVPERETQLVKYFSDVRWSHQLAYLANTLIKFNKFKLSVRGRSKSMFCKSFPYGNFAYINCFPQPSHLPFPSEPPVFQHLIQSQS